MGYTRKGLIGETLEMSGGRGYISCFLEVIGDTICPK